MRRTVRTICVLLAIAVFSSTVISGGPAAPQNPPPDGRGGATAADGTRGLIMGRVADATSGQPIAGAIVSLGPFQASAEGATSRVVLGNVAVAAPAGSP